MRIHMYNKDGSKYIADLPVESANLPPMVYTYSGTEYKFYHRGSSRTTTMYYEGVAMHVTKPDRIDG